MRKSSIAVLGAASNIGLRPYDDLRPRAVDQAPRVLRELGLVGRLRARDAGDLTPQPYRDFTRPPMAVRNEDELRDYLPRLADWVKSLLRDGAFPVVIGGDCSIVVGCMLGARRATPGSLALAYLDAHADFATPQESRTGSAASMCLAMTVGRGDSSLARIDPAGPLVAGSDVVIVGRRDNADQIYGEPFLERHHVLNLSAANLALRGPDEIASTVLERVARSDAGGFWIHLDADVLDASVMQAVDTPEPGGPDFAVMTALLRSLAGDSKALGLELTIYDPGLDQDRSAGKQLVEMIVGALT